VDYEDNAGKLRTSSTVLLVGFSFMSFFTLLFAIFDPRRTVECFILAVLIFVLGNFFYRVGVGLAKLIEIRAAEQKS